MLEHEDHEEETLRMHREEIERIDHEIQRLVNERAEHAMEVALIKIENGGAEELEDFLQADKEAEILHKISEYNSGPLSDYAVANIFRAIMTECLSLQNYYDDDRK